jgi:hypothetical protein
LDNRGRSIAVMQPYIFPYLGYFQLINAVDEFVFYDDVNFIKRGWINRNRILINAQEHLISFPCIKASQNKLINEVKIDTTNKQYSKNLDSIALAYKKSPYFKSVYPLIKSLLNENYNTIADFNIESIKAVSNFLDLNTKFKTSSENFSQTKKFGRSERLKKIIKHENASCYINALGGQELYNKSDFKASDIDLYFLKSNLKPYKQFSDEFVPGLSIIDILMFNSKEDCIKLLNDYKLV